MIKTVVIDDHALVRSGLVRLLRGLPDLDIAAEGATCADALALARQHAPGLMLIDFSLRDGDGVEAAAAIRSAGIETRVILVTMYSEPFVLAAARREPSILAYVLKDDAFEDLAQAVRAVIAGRKFLSPTIAGEVVLATQDSAGGALTPREIEVLSLIARGETGNEIAKRLGLSAKTVEAHRARIRDKLGAASTADLVRYAVRKGLVPP